ncbi:hypothetical protein HG530_010052 [Fusarium avenaceum]|nr:hypothetical protein HG530_010052 [Fusarium avenaceum]
MLTFQFSPCQALVLLHAILNNRSTTKVIEINLVESVVTSNILLESANENGHHSKNENNDNDSSVDEPEPVDLGIKNMQVLIPSSSPGSFRLAPEYTVAVGNMLLLSRQYNGRMVGAVCFAAILLRAGLHNYTNHTALVGILVDLMVLDQNFVVVVQQDVVVLVILA